MEMINVMVCLCTNKLHLNHPSTKWVRENIYNYKWMFDLFEELCEEYTYRYEKIHTTDLKLRDILREPPLKIPMISQEMGRPTSMYARRIQVYRYD